jgi:predicted cupin superfamily sugar epimerase
MYGYDELVCMLGLVPHPEGGCYSRVYGSETLSRTIVPRDPRRRCFSHIFYCLQGGLKYRIHSLDADEMLHHYLGDCVNVYEFRSDGNMVETSLGKDLHSGEKICYVVKAGTLFGMMLRAEQSYTLIGCTVAPAFQWDAFRIAAPEDLNAFEPEHSDLISAFF